MSIQLEINKRSRIEKEISTIQKNIAVETKKECDNLTRINSVERSISKNTSPSSLSSKNRQITGYQKNILDARKKIATLQQKLAAKSQDLGRAKISLQREEERERKRVYQEEQKYRTQTKRDIEMNSGTTINAAVVHTGEGDININGGVLVGGENNTVTFVNDYKSQLNDIVDKIEVISQNAECDTTDIEDAIISIREELDSETPRAKFLKTAFNGIKAIATGIIVDKIIPLVDTGIEIIMKL